MPPILTFRTWLKPTFHTRHNDSVALAPFTEALRWWSSMALAVHAREWDTMQCMTPFLHLLVINVGVNILEDLKIPNLQNPLKWSVYITNVAIKELKNITIVKYLTFMCMGKKYSWPR